MNIISKWFRDRLNNDPTHIYNMRKENFISSLDAEQKQWHESMKGASTTEVILRLEKRIRELENKA